MRLTLFAMYNWWYLNNNIPIYLNELKRHSDKLVVLCNHSQIDTKMLKRIQDISTIEFMENYWYDFWMYNAYFCSHPIDIKKYDKIVICNDSMLIVKPLDEVFNRLDKTKKEYVWIQDWYMCKKNIDDYVKWSKINNKDYQSPYNDWWHIESWFLQFQGKSKDLLVDLMRSWVPKDKIQTIMEYEIKRWQIAKKQYTTETLYKCEKITQKHKPNTTEKDKDWMISLCYEHPIELLKLWSPFIKKDFRNYWYKKMFKPVIDFMCTEIYKHGS